MNIYETLIMMQCDGDVEDCHRDLTIDEVLNMRERIAEDD